MAGDAPESEGAEMDGNWIWLAVLVVLLYLGERLVVTHDPGRVARTAALMAAWLVVTLPALAIVHFLTYLATSAMLFTLGREAAAICSIACVALFVATPIVTALLVRRGQHWLVAAH
jgi:hypothetical protein